MIRGAVGHHVGSIRFGVDFMGASLLDTGTVADAGVGIDLAAGTPPTKTSTIAGYVDHTVTLGQGGYSRHLTITSTGTIAPSASGAAGVVIPVNAVGGSILNMGLIRGSSTSETGGAGVSIEAHAATVTNDGSIWGGGGGTHQGYGINVAATGAHIINNGLISGGTGVDLAAANSHLVNNATIDGYKGVAISGQGATVINYGKIVSYGYYGIGVSGAGAGAVITNAGTISCQSFASGINLDANAAVINSGVISAGGGGYYRNYKFNGGIGVYMRQGGTLTNSGTITGGAGSNDYAGLANGGAGVYLTGLGSITNSGLIVGGESGFEYIYRKGWYGGAGGAGVDLRPGCVLTNTGTIDGGGGGTTGVGVYMIGGTLTTSGTISGSDAVLMEEAAGTLIVDPGAVFDGNVVGNTLFDDVLKLVGEEAGTLATQFIGFTTVTESAGANWTLSGGMTLAAGSSLQVGGSLSVGGTLTDAGIVDISGGAILQANAGGTISLTGTSSITDGGRLSAQAGGQITVGGVLSLGVTGNADGEAILSGTGALITTGTTAINGDATHAELHLGGGLTWTNEATVNDAGLAELNAAAGDNVTIINSGNFNLASDYADFAQAFTGTDVFDNTGTLSKTGGSGTSFIDMAIVNSGTINANSGTLTLDSTVSNSGSLIASNGATLDLSGATLTNLSGSTLTGGLLRANAGSVVELSNNTSITIDSGTLTLNGAGSEIQALDTANGTQITLDSTLSNITATGTLSVINGRDFAVAANAGAFTNDGLLLLWNTEFTTSRLTIGTTGTLTGYATVTVGGTVNSAGAINCETGELAFLGALTNSGSITTNHGTLQLQSTADNTGSIILNEGTEVFLASVTNAGTLVANGGAGQFSAAVSTTGSVLVNGGTLTFLAGVTNSSTVMVDAGVLQLKSTALNSGLIESAGGASSFAGAVTNQGTIAADGGSLQLLGPVTNSGMLLASDAGTLNLSTGTLLNLSGTTLAGGTLRANAASVVELANNSSIVTDAGKLTLDGAGSEIQALDTANHTQITLDSTLSGIAATGTLSVAGGRNFTATANGGSFTNAGLMVLQDMVFTANTLTVSAGATLEGYATIHGEVVNAGSVMASGGALVFLGGVTNNGTFNTGSQSMTLASALGSGELAIGAGGTLSLVDGAGPGQVIDFLAGSGLVDVAQPQELLGEIAGFGGADQIDMLNLLETSYNYANGVLTVMNYNSVVASLHFTGDYSTGDFSLGSDGHGGTLVKFV